MAFLPSLIYRIQLSRSAAKALASLPPGDRLHVERAIDGLAHNPRPRGAAMLEGGSGELRIRGGTYRILYEVADDVLVVLELSVGRKDAYRRR